MTDIVHKQPTQNSFVISVDAQILTREIATKQNQQTETNRFSTQQYQKTKRATPV